MAIVSVKFKTACHHPPGTNIVSSGPCKCIKTGTFSFSTNLGKCIKKQSIASVLSPFFLCCVPLTIHLGYFYSIKTHNLYPCKEVFQADVCKGSMCIVVPDLLGPIKSHLKGGLYFSLIFLTNVVEIIFFKIQWHFVFFFNFFVLIAIFKQIQWRVISLMQYVLKIMFELNLYFFARI